MSAYCVVAFALVGSSAAIMFMNRQHMRRFEDSLDESQRTIYKEIKAERLRIFIHATMIAGLVGLVLASRSRCFAAAAALTTQTFVYLLWPKSKYMMEHVKTPEQSALWIRKYKHMALLGNVGAVVGLAVYFAQSDM